MAVFRGGYGTPQPGVFRRCWYCGSSKASQAPKLGASVFFVERANRKDVRLACLQNSDQATDKEQISRGYSGRFIKHSRPRKIADDDWLCTKKPSHNSPLKERREPTLLLTDEWIQQLRFRPWEFSQDPKTGDRYIDSRVRLRRRGREGFDF